MDETVYGEMLSVSLDSINVHDFYLYRMSCYLYAQHILRLPFSFVFWVQLQSMGLSFRTTFIRKRHHSGMHRLQVIWFPPRNSIISNLTNLILPLKTMVWMNFRIYHLATESNALDELLNLWGFLCVSVWYLAQKVLRFYFLWGHYLLVMQS